MAYKVTFGDLSFKASFFDIQHSHAGDTWGMPGAIDTQISVRLWVISSDTVNIDSNTRQALFEYANWFRGDDRNKPEVLTVEVELNNQEGSHKYTVENAWLRYFSEYQETTYGPDTVDIIVPRVDPGETPRAAGIVERGEVSTHIRIELLFLGFIDRDQGSRLE